MVDPSNVAHNIHYGYLVVLEMEEPEKFQRPRIPTLSTLVICLKKSQRNPYRPKHKKTPSCLFSWTKPEQGSLFNGVAPPEHWTKLNVDGASKGNPGATGAGGVLTVHYGNWIKGFAINLDTCTFVKVELISGLA